MELETWIAIGVIALIVGLAALYVIRAKKKGKKCVGCPESNCPGHCHCDQKNK
jgi:hypothetical protein